MRTRLVLAAAVAVTVLLIAGAFTALASSGAHTATESYYVKQTWHAISGPNVKEGKPTDIYAFQSTIKTLAGKSVGSVNGYGTNLRQPFVAWNLTAILPGGAIAIASTENLKDGPHVLVITGGTGHYLGARGTVTLSDAGDHGNLAVLTLQPY